MWVKFLRAVSARAGDGSRVTGLLSPALHGERGLAMAVDIWVGAVVFSWPGGHGEILRWSTNLPSAWEAVAGTGGFVGNLATQNIRKTVAGGEREEKLRWDFWNTEADLVTVYYLLPVGCWYGIHRAVSGADADGVGWRSALCINGWSLFWAVGPWSRSLKELTWRNKHKKLALFCLLGCLNLQLLSGRLCKQTLYKVPHSLERGCRQ